MDDDILEDDVQLKDNDFDDLDIEAEDALLEITEDDEEFSTLESYREGDVEYVDEEGNPVQIDEDENIELVEVTETYTEETFGEEDILEVEVDAELDPISDSVILSSEVYDNASFEATVNSREVEGDFVDDNYSVSTLQYGDNQKMYDETEKHELVEIKLEDVPTDQKVESSDLLEEESEEENQEEKEDRRGRFHSERPTLVSLSASRKRKNIPDNLESVISKEEAAKLDEVLAKSREQKMKKKGLRGRGRRIGHYRQRYGRGDVGIMEFQHSWTEPLMRQYQRQPKVFDKPPLVEEPSQHESLAGSRKILVNPHFRGPRPPVSDNKQTSENRLFLSRTASQSLMPSQPQSFYPPSRIDNIPQIENRPPAFDNSPLSNTGFNFFSPERPLPSRDQIVNAYNQNSGPQQPMPHSLPAYRPQGQPPLLSQEQFHRPPPTQFQTQAPPPPSHRADLLSSNTFQPPSSDRWQHHSGPSSGAPTSVPGSRISVGLLPGFPRNEFRILPLHQLPPRLSHFPPTNQPPPVQNRFQFNLQQPPPFSPSHPASSVIEPRVPMLQQPDINHPPPFHSQQRPQPTNTGIFSPSHQEPMRNQFQNEPNRLSIQHKQSRSHHSEEMFLRPSFYNPQYRQKRSSTEQVPNQNVILTKQPRMALKKLLKSEMPQKKQPVVNPNIKEVPIVENLPVEESVKNTLPPEIEEDEETKELRKKIEEQKKKREEFLKKKEERRRLQAAERLKEVQKRREQEVQNKDGVADASGTVRTDITSSAVGVQKTEGNHQNIPLVPPKKKVFIVKKMGNQQKNTQGKFANIHQNQMGKQVKVLRKDGSTIFYRKTLNQGQPGVVSQRNSNIQATPRQVNQVFKNIQRSGGMRTGPVSSQMLAVEEELQKQAFTQLQVQRQGQQKCGYNQQQSQHRGGFYQSQINQRGKFQQHFGQRKPAFQQVLTCDQRGALHQRPGQKMGGFKQRLGQQGGGIQQRLGQQKGTLQQPKQLNQQNVEKQNSEQQSIFQQESKSVIPEGAETKTTNQPNRKIIQLKKSKFSQQDAQEGRKIVLSAPNKLQQQSPSPLAAQKATEQTSDVSRWLDLQQQGQRLVLTQKSIQQANVAGNLQQPVRVVRMGPSNQRTVLAPKTQCVLVENLAASTTENSLRDLCRPVGPVEDILLEKLQKKATIKFRNPLHALQFQKKYQRHMLDLSLIHISLLPP
ncbi:uncharacterized protein LOC143246251 [Tachypleus tridentatus]|uniref:uncharacterized protein LOC143246251 n=1 Tax=Tachypleus tridentatus TaxID=6853 RepID=UPI003FD073A8